MRGISGKETAWLVSADFVIQLCAMQSLCLQRSCACLKPAGALRIVDRGSLVCQDVLQGPSCSCKGVFAM